MLLSSHSAVMKWFAHTRTRGGAAPPRLVVSDGTATGSPSPSAGGRSVARAVAGRSAATSPPVPDVGTREMLRRPLSLTAVTAVVPVAKPSDAAAAVAPRPSCGDGAERGTTSSADKCTSRRPATAPAPSEPLEEAAAADEGPCLLLPPPAPRAGREEEEEFEVGAAIATGATSWVLSSRPPEYPPASITAAAWNQNAEKPTVAAH